MSNAKVFEYDNPLKKTLVRKGGMSADEAIPAAQANVDEIRDPTLADLDACLEEFAILSERLRREAPPEVLTEMYRASNRILAIAGLFGLADLGHAAHSLCELLTRFQATRRMKAAMISVHVDGMRRLRHPETTSEQERERVLSGLRALTLSVK